MRPLFVSILLLVCLTGFAVWTSHAVGNTALRLSEQLEQTDALADRGDWHEVRDTLAVSYADWQRCHRYLRMVLPHHAVDSAESMYCRAQAFAETEELTEFRAEVAGLRSQLLQMAESERFLAENIL